MISIYRGGLSLINNKNDILITRGRTVTNITVYHTLPLFYTLQMIVPQSNHIGLSSVYLIIYALVAFAIRTHAAGIKCLMGRLQCDDTIFQLRVTLFWYKFVIYLLNQCNHTEFTTKTQSKLKGQDGNRYVNSVTELSGKYTLYKAGHWFEVKGTHFLRNSTNVSWPNKSILNQM